jgi:hypothetical protein
MPDEEPRRHESSGSPETFRSALDRTIDEIDGGEVTLRRLVELMGDRGLLFLCALLTIPFLLPVSIPGVSTVFGAAIILISLGISFDRKPWLPGRIMDRPIDGEKLTSVLRKGSGIVGKIETYIKPRLLGMTEGRLVGRINGLALMLGGVLLLFPLGLVPLSNTLPAFGVLFLAVGISQRDGALVLAGYAMMVATIIYFGILAWLVFVAGRGLASLFGG